MVLKGFILSRSTPVPTGSAEPDYAGGADGDGDGNGAGDAYRTYQRAVRARSRLLASLGLRFDRVSGLGRWHRAAERQRSARRVHRDGDAGR